MFDASVILLAVSGRGKQRSTILYINMFEGAQDLTRFSLVFYDEFVGNEHYSLFRDASSRG